IVDRQLAIKGTSCRFDLTAVYLEQGEWNRSNKAPLTLFEIKYGLNQDIQKIDEQLYEYYKTIQANMNDIAKETQSILRQKLELDLIKQKSRIQAYRRLADAPNIWTN